MNRCHFCKAEIDPAFDFQAVTGWERVRPPVSTKGKSLSAQRRHTDKFACAKCVADLKAGRTPGQEAFPMLTRSGTQALGG